VWILHHQQQQGWSHYRLQPSNDWASSSGTQDNMYVVSRVTLHEQRPGETSTGLQFLFHTSKSGSQG
jgi:hypothetical protein